MANNEPPQQDLHFLSSALDLEGKQYRYRAGCSSTSTLLPSDLDLKVKSADLDEVSCTDEPHVLEQHSLPSIVFEYSTGFGLDETFLEILQM